MRSLTQWAGMNPLALWAKSGAGGIEAESFKIHPGHCRRANGTAE